MKITILTLFPHLFKPFLETSILDRAHKIGKVDYQLMNLRDFGVGTHKSVDDRPFGGGPGMILRADVLASAVESITKLKNETRAIILTSASGTPFKQKMAWKFSQFDHLIIVCGHYEGIDQRFIDQYVDFEVSIGDYVLTGGEIPALAILDTIVRLLPNVLKKEGATEDESFSQNLIEYPHFTRPEEFQGQLVPKILLSGNHLEIKKWRMGRSIEKTKKVRPDLLK